MYVAFELDWAIFFINGCTATLKCIYQTYKLEDATVTIRLIIVYKLYGGVCRFLAYTHCRRVNCISFLSLSSCRAFSSIRLMVSGANPYPKRRGRPERRKAWYMNVRVLKEKQCCYTYITIITQFFIQLSCFFRVI